MSIHSRGIAQLGAFAVLLFAAGCASSGYNSSVYVGVSGPGPWYGYPGYGGYGGPYGYPGRVGGGVVIGYPCCEEDDAEDMFDAASAFDRYDDAEIRRDSAGVDRLRKGRATGVQVLDFETELEPLQRQNRHGPWRYQ